MNLTLASWFWKRYIGDLPEGGKSPTRKRVESRLKRFRDTRVGEKTSAGAKKMQDDKGIYPDTAVRLMG